MVWLQKDLVHWSSLKGVAVFRKLKNVFSFVFGVIWISALPSVFVGLYTYLVVYVMVLGSVWGWGVLVWVVPVVMLGPVVVVWLRVLQRRYRAYLALMLGSARFVWDIDAAVKGWVDITRGKKRREKD